MRYSLGIFNFRLKGASKKILLFSTFSTEVNVEDADAVIKDLKELDIQLIAMYDDLFGIFNTNSYIYFEFYCRTENPKQQQSNDLIMQFIDRITNGVLCSLDEAVIKLAEIDKKRRNFNARHYNLSFEKLNFSKFHIELTAYVHVRIFKQLVQMN